MRTARSPTQHDRILIQSFYKEGLVRIERVAWATPCSASADGNPGREGPAIGNAGACHGDCRYAQGVGPARTSKELRRCRTFHKAGLVIHPYTFRARQPPCAQATR
jgi:glycerophosphoryl diester phosphodiesterase